MLDRLLDRFEGGRVSDQDMLAKDPVKSWLILGSVRPQEFDERFSVLRLPQNLHDLWTKEVSLNRVEWDESHLALQVPLSMVQHFLLSPQDPVDDVFGGDHVIEESFSCDGRDGQAQPFVCHVETVRKDATVAIGNLRVLVKCPQNSVDGFDAPDVVLGLAASHHQLIKDRFVHLAIFAFLYRLLFRKLPFIPLQSPKKRTSCAVRGWTHACQRSCIDPMDQSHLLDSAW